MDIKIIGHNFDYDITSMSMLFFPGEKVFYKDRSSADKRLFSYLYRKDDRIVSVTKLRFYGKIFTCQITETIDYDAKNLVKQTFYKVCSKATGITSPWGILTGIRPLSVYSRLSDPRIQMENEYYVHPDKIDLLAQIYKAESVIEKRTKDVSVYISIPFCPGKCTYCSFISISATSKGALLSQYLEKLLIEIKLKSKIISELDLRVKSLYIGGGTPGILDASQLSLLLNALKEAFDLASIEETCIELGRPDTVDLEKLDIIDSFGFDRICINTQTTNDDVLNKVNRNHNFMQYRQAVINTQKHTGAIINTDLIAGLPGENLDSFKKSVDDVISLGVDNVTVHTLAIKRSAKLSDDSNNFSPRDNTVDSMIDYAYTTLKREGYIPYYIYRQKNCISNGENIGFCKPGSLCKYNVYMMEDIHSIIACGAGASSKIIKGKKVDRVINVKYPMEYVNEFYKIENNTNKLKEMFINE